MLYVSTRGQTRPDTTGLHIFVQHLYQWHRSQVMFDKGFDPRKDYKGIDFNAIEATIKKYRKTGYFAEPFLKDYRAIARRMDRELRTGVAVWHEGDLPPFNGTNDPFCNCDIAPVRLKIVIKTIVHHEVIFAINNVYEVKAVKENGVWKITYMEGFDFKSYKWKGPGN